jgi:hypothetical protein
MATQRNTAPSKQPNEGEGNKTADREYRQRTSEFVKSGRVEPSAKEAEKAVKGREGAELRKAEEIGKQHAKH